MSESKEWYPNRLGATTSDWTERLEYLVQEDLYREQRHHLRAQYCPDLSYGRHFAPPVPSAKPAAVMILLEQPEPGAHWSRCTIPLTVRPEHLADHPGQISLPGGRVEKFESYEQAATREFREELGVDEFPGKILGPLLPLWVFNSNYRLQPFLAIHTGHLNYRPCKREVDRLIHLPASELVCSQSVDRNYFSRGEVRWQAGVFKYQNDQIWGATAIVLAELVAIFRALD